jgi:phage regulator Rha-like protein
MTQEMIVAQDIPAPAALGLRLDGSVALVNSRDVAEAFGKQHAHVLRDIDALLAGAGGASTAAKGGHPNLDGLSNQVVSDWFRLVLAWHEEAQRETRSFDLTRDGFTLLVMGWTGERAMQFKVAYIQAFNAMETSLRANGPDERFLAAVREIVAPLAVRFSGQDEAIDRVAARVDGIAEDVAYLKHVAHTRRRALSEATRRGHLEDIRSLGGRCPCCNMADVVTADAARTPFAEFDHFYASSHPNGAHTWLICKPCHTGLTAGRVPREQREAEFRAYQNKRRRLPGRQQTLFG